MGKKRIYLDYNASAPLLESAREAMLALMDLPGNASSVHQEGRAHRAALDKARQIVASSLGAKSDNVIFTSGATEAAVTVLTPHWQMGRAALAFSDVIIGATEHPCMIEGGRFAVEQRAIMPVKSNGVADLGWLGTKLDKIKQKSGRAIIALQLANSETGIIQPITEVAALVHQFGGLLIVDATQALGRIAIDLANLDADALIISAHKVGGPKGVGAIVHASDILRPQTLLSGGGQEKSFRSGTENSPAIAGFGAALSEAMAQMENRSAIKAMRDTFESKIQSHPAVTIYGYDAPRLDNTTYFSTEGKKAEMLQIAFDLAGIAVSPGSACSSGKVGSSHVLDAMGIDAPDGAIRVSFGPDNTMHDISDAIAVIEKMLSR